MKLTYFALLSQITKDIPSHRDIQRRSRHLSIFDEVPVFGSFSQLGYYYAEVYVGTPAQTATVILDTGSSVTAFPCVGCSACGTHLDAKFDTSASSTCSKVACGSECAGHSCKTDHCGYYQVINNNTLLASKVTK